MAEIERQNATPDPLAFLDLLYDQTRTAFGDPLEFNLFNFQLCKHLDLGWLLEQADSCGAGTAEVETLVERGVIRTFTDEEGNSGFILYTPQQIKTFKELQSLGRFSDEELRYIMLRWNEDIECTVEVIPYDDFNTPDIEAYQRRIFEHLNETKQQISWRVERDPSDTQPDEQLAWLTRELAKYEKLVQKVSTWTPETLTAERKDRMCRNLFRMRWIDEYIRAGNAERYRAAIIQGFSPDVFFSAYSQNGDEFKFERIDWHLTLDTLQRRVREGKRFPLRTPSFELSESGLLLKSHHDPGTYREIYEQYQLEQLRDESIKLGTQLWSPEKARQDLAICAGCGEPFQRGLAAKRYCSEKCRSRAKQRRYRERDPERARLAQARYWKDYVEDPNSPN